MRHLMLATCAALALSAQAAAAADDSDPAEMPGAALYADSCRSCHGPKAQGMASFPKLADKDAEYLTMRLEQYRAGETVGPNTGLMQPNAADLSDEQIADLAAYISTAFQ